MPGAFCITPFVLSIIGGLTKDMDFCVSSPEIYAYSLSNKKSAREGRTHVTGGGTNDPFGIDSDYS